MVWDRFVAFPKIAARVHYGLASTMLGQLPVGGCVPGIVRTLQSDFHLPDDKSAPSVATRDTKGTRENPQEMERPGDEHVFFGGGVLHCCLKHNEFLSQNLMHACKRGLKSQFCFESN